MNTHHQPGHPHHHHPHHHHHHHEHHLRDKVPPRIQRMAWVILGILLQLGIVLGVLTFFNQYFVYFYWFSVVVSIAVALYISTRPMKLAYKVAWIIPILLVPVFGGILYLVLGGARRMKFDQAGARRTYKRELKTRLDNIDLLRYGSDAAQQAWYLQDAALCPAYGETETEYFPSGEKFFPRFLLELEQAKRYIFLEYFIIADGSMWQEILEILKRKADQGVEVRVIYDGFGSATVLDQDYADRLEDMGIYCRPFQPFEAVLSVHQNNRDHRKLCVIDGVAGFVSGLNIADEYVGRLKRFGYWKDNALLVRGEAVWSMTVFFLAMWEAQGGEKFHYADYRPAALPELSDPQGVVIPYADTPFSEDTVCADLMLKMISKAKNYLFLTTPYLVLDETLTAALCVAAKSGVDVRVMTPHIPDKKTVFAVTRSNYLPLIKAGVRIYEFTPGFMHSKTVVADDLYASVGSCNLDYRSLYLQFENGVWMCGTDAVMAVRDDFLDTIPQCQEFNEDDCKLEHWWKRLLVSLYRMFSPLF